MSLHSCLTRLRCWFRSAPPAATTRLRPRLEQLEARDVPAADLNQTYLATLYQGFLGRPLDPTGLSYWGGVLNSTHGDRTAVAADILRSQEYYGRELQLVYPALLGRALDNLGLQYWGNGILETGGTYEQVKAGIFGSQEYYNRVGNDFTNVLTGVFQSQLGRPPTEDEEATYKHMLGQNGGDRTAVVQQILNSDDAHAAALNSVYQLILSRPLDPAGASFWVGALRGGTIDTALAGVVGSDEFFGQLAGTVTSGTARDVTDINEAASDFLNAAGKFAAQMPGVEQLDRFLVTNAAMHTAPPVVLTRPPTVPSSVSTGPDSTTTLPSTITLPRPSPVTPATGTDSTQPGYDNGSSAGTQTNYATTYGGGALQNNGGGALPNTGTPLNSGFNSLL
jgi:hypothetical protein